MAGLNDTQANEDLNRFLETRWWALLLRGLLSILFGVICFVSPQVAGFSLLLVFAVFSIVDGLFGVAASAGAARRGERWVWLAVESVASIVIGGLLLAMPSVTVAVLFFVIAVKAAITGVLLLVSSIKLDGEHGQGLLAISGVINMLFAVVLFTSPMLGMKIVVWWIGAWSILFGLALVLLSFKLKRFVAAA